MFGGSSEFALKGSKLCSPAWCDPGPEVVFEEVPFWLSVDIKHCNEITGVNTVSQEFKTETWGKNCFFTWSLSCRESGDTLVCSLENSCVWVLFIGNKSYLTDSSNLMNILDSFSKESLWHDITFAAESWFHWL